ncbi:MAG TPA: PAS domain S-box protein [Burkholderiaceae bacterium]|nr:PAS domain S-box protein [Burkholderiaceae bacterium]
MNPRAPDPSDAARAPAGVTLHAFLTRLIWWCMGPLVLLAAYLAIDRVGQVRNERGIEVANVAKVLAASVDQELNARIGALTVLAASPLLDDAARWKDLYQEAQGFRQSFGSHVILADLRMQMRFNTRVPYGTPLPPLPRPKGRAAAPLAAETGRPAVGDSFQGPVANERLIAVAVPAVRDGKTVALLLTVFEVRQFQKHLEQIALPPGWSLALLDGNGEPIARRTPEDFKPAEDVDASARVVVKSKASPWSVVVEVPRDLYREPLLQAGAALALAVLGATGAGVVGGVLAGRRLGSSVASLARAPAPGTRPPDIVEIAAVRRWLDQAARERESAEATLLISEQRLRRLFYEAPLPQMLVAKSGVTVDLNARFVQVFGYGLEDMPTLADWWARAYPDPAYRRSASAVWNAAIAQDGDHAPTGIEPSERRIVCKDGTVRTMVVSGIGIGENVLFAYFDVTERKAAEEAARQSAVLYQHTLDNMLEGCQIIDFDWRYRYINAAGAQQHGQPSQSLIGRTVTEVYPGVEATEVHAKLSRCMEERIAEHGEIEFVFPDGRRCWFDLNVQPAPQGIAVFSVDITERKRVQEVRQRMTAIVQSSDDAIVSSTTEGVVTSWNHGAERMFGIAAREAIGKPVREVIRAEDDEAARLPERRVFRPRQDASQIGAEEIVRLHKDGRPITLSVVTGVIRDDSGAISELAAIMRDITPARQRDAELRRLVAEQAERERLLRDLTERLRTLREEECMRISREVHDGLGQLLTCLKMEMRWLSRKLAAGASAQDLSAKLGEAEALVDQTVASVQQIAVELRPSALDALGLAAAIRDEVRRFGTRTGVMTVVETSTSSSPGAAIETALFRILQELLTNIARHAQATSLSITLTEEEGAWVLRVRDNGIGIPADMARRGTSLGLLGMTERAAAIGGTCRVERAPNGGTIATVRVPHPVAAEDRHAVRTDS